MAEVLPLSETELRLLESLVRHHVQFMVVGLSAAALQGAPVITQDVDLWSCPCTSVSSYDWLVLGGG